MRIMIIPAVQSTNRSGPRSKCAAALRHLGIHRGVAGAGGALSLSNLRPRRPGRSTVAMRIRMSTIEQSSMQSSGPDGPHLTDARMTSFFHVVAIGIWERLHAKW